MTVTMTSNVIREDLLRSASFTALRAEGDQESGDGRTLTGYAAVFETPTLIDSWEGTFYEKIRKGAFRKSIRERTPVMQFDHGHHPLIGSIPIGRISELREDDDGLYVSGRLSDNWLIQPLRDAIAEESIDGMSFRFTVIREEWRDSAGKLLKDDAEIMQLLWRPDERGPLERTLTEVKVHELGPVVWPAYAETSVGVRARSLAAAVGSDEEFRRAMRRVLATGTVAAESSEPEYDLSDPQLRHEVARVLLFDRTTETSEPPVVGRASDTATPSGDAPPPHGHPSDDTDAPPLDGHPSADHQPSRTDKLRDQIREITGLMGHVLAPIAKDNPNGTVPPAGDHPPAGHQG